MLHLHARHGVVAAGALRADAFDREVDIDLAGLLELQRGFDVLAFG